MTKHSPTEHFDFTFEDEVYPCSFFITDDRLITAMAAGHRRTIELGGTPPLALAESIWAEMLHDARAPQPAARAPQPPQQPHWIEKMLCVILKPPGTASA
jgi:hypothetical protein